MIYSEYVDGLVLVSGARRLARCAVTQQRYIVDLFVYLSLFFFAWASAVNVTVRSMK